MHKGFPTLVRRPMLYWASATSLAIQSEWAELLTKAVRQRIKHISLLLKRIIHRSLLSWALWVELRAVLVRPSEAMSPVTAGLQRPRLARTSLPDTRLISSVNGYGMLPRPSR